MDWKEVRKQAMEEKPGKTGLLGTASIMGLHMVTGPAVGAGLGWLADSWFDSFPWGAAVGLFLGLAAGVRNVWVDARWLARANERIDAEAAPSEKSASLPAPSGTGKAHVSPAEAPEPAPKNRFSPVPDDRPEENFDESTYASASILAGTDIPVRSDPKEKKS